MAMLKIFNIILLTMGMVYSQNMDSLFSDGNEYYNKNQFNEKVFNSTIYHNIN